MATMTITRAVEVAGATPIAKQLAKTGTLLTLLSEEAVADAQTDYEITTTIDVSAVKAFYLVSTQNVTFETNNGSTPTNTISLLANQPYEYITGDYNSFLLTGDVTSVFITNASGSQALVSMYVLVDPTP